MSIPDGVARMDLGLDGARVIVTAASKGLGRAIATRFVMEGARVAIASRDAVNLADAKDHIIGTTDAEVDRVVTVPIDLTVEDEIRSGIPDAIERLGGLDVLVTNHGGPPAKGFTDTTVEDFDAVYESVLRSTVLVVKSALPAFEGGGAITNLVSASAREPPTNHVLSNTLRPGIYGLSKSLSRELGEDGIRVNCVAPRGVMTDRIRYKIEVLAENEGISDDEAHAMRTAELAVDSLGEPPTFAKAVAFISSPAAAYITGTTLTVDGGFTRGAF